MKFSFKNPELILSSAFVMVVSSASGNTLGVDPLSRRVSDQFHQTAVGIIHCQDGFAYDPDGTAQRLSCAEACKDAGVAKCCYGDDACTGFTGMVSMDGSCTGQSACYNAGKDGNVGKISGASCNGDYACHGAGSEGGGIGNITGSCQGVFACKHAAYESGNNIYSIDNCCNSDGACEGITNDDGLNCNLPVTPSPTNLPTNQPTPVPTAIPTGQPTLKLVTPSPTNLPTNQPTPMPTGAHNPTQQPVKPVTPNPTNRLNNVIFPRGKPSPPADPTNGLGRIRRLQEDADSIVAGNEEASFDLEISLQQEFGSDEDPIVSAASLKSKGVVSLGLLFAMAYKMW